MTSKKEQELIWTLEDAGHYDEAKIVRALAQQRAELLEALKYAKDTYDFSGELSAQAMRKIDAAINKAEATE